MSEPRKQIDAVEAVVEKHLFLLCPNNSGSTYLSQAIAQSRKVWSLKREGQHTFGFAGPDTANSKWPLIWGAADESITHFAQGQYDWERTRKAWYLQAQSSDVNAPVFHTRSPPFLLIPDQLVASFAKTRFLLMVRDPYAALEGILRRWTRSSQYPAEELPAIGARHLVTCFEHQRRNRERFAEISAYFTYEQLCEDPADIATRIAALMPELDDLDLTQRLSVKGAYDEPLRNMNADQIARLAPGQIAAATAVFRENESLFAAFDYQLRD